MSRKRLRLHREVALTIGLAMLSATTAGCTLFLAEDIAIEPGDGLEFGDVRDDASTIDLYDTRCDADNIRVVLQFGNGWTVSGANGTTQFGPSAVSDVEVDDLLDILSTMPEADCTGGSCTPCRQQSLSVNSVEAYRACCGDQNPQFETDFDEVADAMRAWVPSG